MATAPTTGDAAETRSNAAELRADEQRSDEQRADEQRADDAAGGDRRRGWRAWRGWSLGRKDTSARTWRPRRRIGLIDVLRVLGLARRAVPRPVVGPKAYPQWWQRVLALLVLVVVVVGIGFALAALVGIMVVVAGFLLEQAIS